MSVVVVVALALFGARVKRPGRHCRYLSPVIELGRMLRSTVGGDTFFGVDFDGQCAAASVNAASDDEGPMKEHQVMPIGFAYLFAAIVLTGAWFVLLRVASASTPAMLTQIIHVLGTVIGVLVFLGPALWLTCGSAPPPALGRRWYCAILAGIVICAANTLMFKAYEAKVPLSVVSVMLRVRAEITLHFGGSAGWSVARHKEGAYL